MSDYTWKSSQAINEHVHTFYYSIIALSSFTKLYSLEHVVYVYYNLYLGVRVSEERVSYTFGLKAVKMRVRADFFSHW